MEKQINNAAFMLMVETNKGVLFKIAYSFCSNEADSKDLVQEIILKLWQSFSDYHQKGKQSTWIYRVGLNTAISYYRKEKTRNSFNTPLSEQIMQVADIPTNREADVKINFLYQFLQQLKELDRALMLLYLEEKSHKEIAEIMGITTSNVATKIGRIKIILKQKFDQISI